MQFQEEQDYNKRFDLNLWKRLFYYARPFYKYLVGVAVAFVSGYFAIYLLRMIVQRGKFGGFAYYCWGAGLVTLILSLTV